MAQAMVGRPPLLLGRRMRLLHLLMCVHAYAYTHAQHTHSVYDSKEVVKIVKR